MLIPAFFLMLFCLACNSVPENWYICVNKCQTYLLTFDRVSMEVPLYQSPPCIVLGAIQVIAILTMGPQFADFAQSEHPKGRP